jgi:hypothetical protein
MIITLCCSLVTGVAGAMLAPQREAVAESWKCDDTPTIGGGCEVGTGGCHLGHKVNGVCDPDAQGTTDCCKADNVE